MNTAYDQLRRHYKDLPELPESAENWTPEDPRAIRDAINRRNVRGYVDRKILERLDYLINEAEKEAQREDPTDFSKMTFKERFDAYPDWMTMEEKTEADIEAYESLEGPEVRIVSKPGEPPAVGWDAVEGWVAERYQVMGRSIGLHGRGLPVKDDPFGTWERDENGKWTRIGIRMTWNTLGGYDPAIGPYRGACERYEIVKRWLEGSGPGPWEITVAAYFDGRGWVYGNLVEWPEPEPQPEEWKERNRLVSDIHGYIEQEGWPPIYYERWKRTLAALGVLEYPDPMTAKEAQELADRRWARWVPVVKILKKLEEAE